MTVDGVHIHTVDGVRLSVHLRPPAASAPSPEHTDVAVVVVHGFSASASDPSVVAVMRALSDAGWIAITYDARGHGASGGETTLGELEQHDVAAAVQLARARAARVVLVGTSMGGIAALRYAAARPDDLAGVVTVACPAEWRLPRNVRGVVAALMVETRLGRRLARSRLGVRIAPSIDRGAPPVQLAASIDLPVAVLHGTDDPFIHRRAAEHLHTSVRGPAQLVLVDGLAHAFEPAALAKPAVVDAVTWVLSS